MEKQYKNTVLDDILGKITGKTAHEEEMARLALLEGTASKSAASTSLLYIIPIVALVIFGVIFAVVVKRKK